MKKLILIGGVLAAGKSTYSMILKEKYHLNVINKDRLKEIFGDNIPVSNREENKKLSVLSFEIMMYLIESNESTLLLESNFKDYELSILKKRCDELGYKVLSLVFDAPDEILHQRFQRRLGENRHYVHKSQDFTNIVDFRITLDELRRAEYPGEVIKVDCSEFSYQSDSSLFEKIENFLDM